MTIAFVGHAAPQQAEAASAYEDDPSLPLEVHLIRFPSRVAYNGYLTDGRRIALMEPHGEVFTSKVVVELDTVAGAGGEWR